MDIINPDFKKMVHTKKQNLTITQNFVSLLIY